MDTIEIGMSRSRLVHRFETAHLPLELAEQPIGTTNAAIFGMDIRNVLHHGRRAERFRIWPGDATNRVEVMGMDARLTQLVLMVHEPARSFDVRVDKRIVAPSDRRIVRQDGKYHWILRERTLDSKRHYLCGTDERQLFIAQLPRGVSTVRDAHHVLKADEVLSAERRGSVKRQGEWFFVELGPEERQRLIGELATAILWHRRAIGVGGHPHVAEQLVRLPRSVVFNGRAALAEDVYVRGSVRHVDHRTVVLQQWHKAVRNTEPNAGRMNGIAWID